MNKWLYVELLYIQEFVYKPCPKNSMLTLLLCGNFCNGLKERFIIGGDEIDRINRCC